MTAYSDIRFEGTRSGHPAGLGLFALSIIAAIGVFWYGLISLGAAWSTPEYSHGPVIPVLSAYMFLIEMKRVRPVASVDDRWPGVAIVAVALLIGVVGNLVKIPDIVTYALILWIWGMVLTLFGLRRGWVLWPGVLHLVFMLPLPQFIYWQFSTWLQQVSSEIGVALISAFGIPVFLDGVIIDLGVYKLQVAEACSGLRYLFPVMSFSYVFGVLYTGPRWHKIVLLLAAMPITVLMNSFRIGMIGILVNQYGIGQAEGFLHTFEGWIIFVACICILFLIAVLLQQTRKHPQPLRDTIEIDLSSVVPEIKRVFDIRPNRALAAAALGTALVAVAVHATPSRPQVMPAREPLAVFPHEVGGWIGGGRQRLEPSIERVLGADDYLSTIYANAATGDQVRLFIAYYNRQTEGTGIHSPEVCIPGGGWEVSDWNERTLSVRTAEGGTEAVPATVAVIRKGLRRELVLYWFEQRGSRTNNDFVAKAWTVMDAATRGRTDGALVRLITPLAAGESVDQGLGRMTAYLAEMLPDLNRFVPD